MIRWIERARVALALLLFDLASRVLPAGYTVRRELKPEPFDLGPVYPPGWGPADDPCGFASGE